MKYLIAFVWLGLCTASEFSYEGDTGPEFWSQCFPECGGRSQSPIDLPGAVDSKFEAVFDKRLETLEFNNYGRTFTGTIKNTGDTIEVLIPEGINLILAQGGLPSKFRADQFHFHWGSNDNEGSEHTVGGQAFPLEMHIVHYNVIYGSFENALNFPDGLAVVSFLFQISNTDNENYADLIAALHDVKFNGSSRPLYGVNLLKLTLGDLPDRYSYSPAPAFFRYQGSLTTPPCSEVVTWTVIREFIPISSSQVAAFRQVAEISSGIITDENRITENFRPVQPLNGRTVFSSVDPYNNLLYYLLHLKYKSLY